MVTGDEEIKYGYLLDPCFQIVNTAGKPLTQGWIEVYIAGTRNKYYCSSDFAGTLHPFKIPLDSLGSNIILADVEKSYDVYVYNRFGNLAMSRYNITPGKGGAGGSISGSGIAEHWIGKNGQNTSVPAGSDTALKLPTSFEYEGSFIDRINENRTAFYLKEGLYLVQAVVNFKQSDQSLTNEISQVDVFTRSDDTPEDMSFNRDMAGPDSSDDSHCLKVSFIRCVKEDDEVSQIVLFKVNTPNAWSECYLQNVQIARLSSGGAGTGGATYTAGEYIAIDEETNTISVTGIDPDSYATHDEVEQAIESATSAFITSADLPDLSSYATEQWVLDKHYITSADIPDIPEDLVTSAELAQTSGLIEQDIADLTSAISEALSDKMDKSSSADFYPRYDNPEGYLTSIPSEYVTESEMSGYVHEQTSSFITSADLPDVSDMATKTWVTDQHYITSADIPPLPEDLVTSGELATVSGEIVNRIPSLQGYATEEYVTEHTSAFITSADLPDLSDYATEQYVQDAIDSGTSAFITSADLPDVSDMATQTWVGEQGYLTSIPSEYVTDTELESELSGKADTSAIPDVSNFVTQEDIDAAVSGKMDATESSAFYPMATNPSGYLVSSDLNGYATEQYVQDETSAFITSADLPSEEEVQFEELDLSSFVDSAYVSDYVASQTSGKQDTLTFGYDASDKINAINGSAIAGGGSSGPTYSAGSGIDITNDVISIDNTVALKTDIPSLNGYATEQYVDSHTSGKMDTSAYTAPVNADWTSSAGLSEILNKPESTRLLAGTGITISESGADYVISSNGGGGGGSYTAGEFIDITNDVISVNSGDVSNLIPGSGILITQSSAGTTVSIDPEELPKSTPYETTLWEGENGELISADNYSVDLSDDPLSYSRIGLYGRPHENPGCQNYVEFDPSYSAVCKTVTTYMNTTTPVWSVNTYSFSGTNKMTLLSQTHVWGTQSGSGGLWIYKVVGINRKET